MNITCPKCNFSKVVDPAKLPDRPVKVNCPKCSASFSFAKSAEAGKATGETRPQQAPKKDMATPPAGQSHDRRIICNSCGTVQPPAHHCRQCGAAIVTTASRVEPEYAGFWTRVVATVLDSLLLCIVQFVLTLIITQVISLMGIAAGEDPAVNFIVWLFGTTISLGYAVFFIGYCGQTPGKMALRIKVVCTDGSQPTYGRAVKREVLGKFVSSILLGIGYLMVAFDSRKQGLHDKIADTYVIKL